MTRSAVPVTRVAALDRSRRESTRADGDALTFRFFHSGAGVTPVPNPISLSSSFGIENYRIPPSNMAPAERLSNSEWLAFEDLGLMQASVTPVNRLL
jgi:hypothetical protein